MGTYEPPLAAVKLTPPAPPATEVPRTRLERHLATSDGGALTLVTGPTGSGKTALVAGWFARSAPSPRAWLTFDAGDNDPVRFWGYVIAALQRIDRRIGWRAAEMLTESRADPRLLATLIEDVAATDAPATFVVDDFHTITSPALLDDAAWAADHLPPQLHVVLISRSEPPFHLPRLRLTGRLREVRESDLRFRRDEASALLDNLAPGLGEQDLALLTERTEGWAAGLQLAGLSLREHPDRSGFVRRFAGSNRVVADLLLDEVLDRQAPDVRDFLLRTSLLQRFSAPLCDAVTGRRDSARVLRELEDANLFLVPLDDERQWFRYHALFADLLRSELRMFDPDAEHAAHSAAGRWYASEGHPSSAIRHHQAAGDLESAWRVVLDCQAPYFLAGRHETVESWLRSFPHDHLASDPTTAVDAGMTSLLAGRIDQTSTWVGVAERALEQHADDRERARLATLTALLAWYRGDHGAALECLRQVRGALGDRWWPVMTELDLALLDARVRLGLGDPVGTAAALDDLPARRRPFDDVLVLGTTAQADVQAGSLRTAEASLEEALALTGALGPHVGVLMGDLRFVRGSLLLERGLLGAAATELGTSLSQGHRAGSTTSVVQVSVAMARALAGAGKIADARSTLLRAREVVGHRPRRDPLTARLVAAECRLRLAMGRLEAAGRLLDDVPAGAERVRLEVRLHLAAGRSGLARRRLAETPERAPTLRRELEDELLTAHVLAGEDDERALGHLHRAVELAEPEGFVQIFLDEGPEVAALLRRLPQSSAASRLMDAIDDVPPPAWAELSPLGAGHVVEALSDRELGVLRYLPSPLPNREIARALYISPNTLKTHMKNLYRKLEVGSRAEAVARARDLELL